MPVSIGIKRATRDRRGLPVHVVDLGDRGGKDARRSKERRSEAPTA